MIDVPVEVKDALRDGRLKKNYRIVVFQQYTDIYEIYSSHETYVAPTTATYVLYNNTTPHAFSYVEIIPASGESEYSINCPNDPDKTWLEFPLNVGDVIYVAHSDYVMLGVEDENNNTVEFTIDNNNLVTESVSIDERMNSGDKIKFGLCEGSSLEFQYFDKPLITGRRVQVFIDVDYSVMRLVYETILKFVRNQEVTISEDGNYRIYSETPDAFAFVNLTRGGEWEALVPTSTEDGTELIVDLLAEDVLDIGWIGLTTPDVYLQKQVNKKQIESYAIPMGFFDVKKCSRQASTGIIKVTAYNKLMSDYLDAKANDILIDAYNSDELSKLTGITVDALLSVALNDFTIQSGTEIELSYWDATSVSHNIFHEYDENGEETGKWIIVLDCSMTALSPSQISGLSQVGADATQVLNTCIDGLSELNRYIKVYGNLMTVQEYINMRFSTDVFSDPTIRIKYGNSSFDWKIKTYNDPKSPLVRDIDRTVLFKNIPSLVLLKNTSVVTDEEDSIAKNNFKSVIRDIIQNKIVKIIKISETELGSTIINDITTLPDITLRELQSAVYETACQFGQLDRTTDLFSGVELNYSRLFPQETLYPDDALYPDGAQSSATKSMYSKLWADDGNVHKWKNLIITYKGLDENQQEKDFTLQRIINADGTDNYDCSDNWLLRNLVWTEPQIWDFANAMALKMQDMTWFPFEMWCAGLPYVETGDEIEIPLGQNSYTSYVLQRQLKGIQNLQDTYINGNLDIF